MDCVHFDYVMGMVLCTGNSDADCCAQRSCCIWILAVAVLVIIVGQASIAGSEHMRTLPS